MEGLHGSEDRLWYALTGHSGDDPAIPLAPGPPIPPPQQQPGDCRTAVPAPLSLNHPHTQCSEAAQPHCDRPLGCHFAPHLGFESYKNKPGGQHPMRNQSLAKAVFEGSPVSTKCDVLYNPISQNKTRLWDVRYPS